MIEIKPLSYFIAAYEEGAITAAASRCYISQPSITHAIKSLETRLGVTLFERSKQGIKPTENGHKLYKLASDLLLQNQQLEAAFTPDNAIELNLYIQPDINIECYLGLIESIKKVPLDIHLSIADSIEQAQLAIIDEQRLPSQFKFKKLRYEGYKLVTSRHHPLAKNKEVSLSSLEGLKFIERPYCTHRKEFERLINEQGISIIYKGKAIHDLQLQGLVKLGLGVAVIPESYTHQRDENLEYISIALDRPITRSIVLAYRQLPNEVIQEIQSA
ncbi:LysR family transcriptional regulator [Vibrio ostreicida]|uniref:LysR family transcriptional regulator n=1 Tax=Vibrio ostreicida TaxID=526588 RepID=A0ABT8BYE0_9VIBR|nr:LysR family transcriptional regulator [Vibrio ostreicida]MDN3611414.1 LysR family transcriptional regulator [Vibrio ostreicida]NPD08923.1 LysR family transcriptional regulator [Vibrio ostreicida]